MRRERTGGKGSDGLDTLPVLRTVLYGTVVVLALLAGIFLLKSVAGGRHDELPRLLGGAGLVVYIGAAGALFFKRLTVVASWMIVGLYAVLGIGILGAFGLNAPFGILFLGFTIMLAGILLGASYSTLVTAAFALLLLGVQFATDIGLLNPDTSSLDDESTYLDVSAYCALFVLFAVLAWLAGRRTDRLLRQSLRAEAALQKEKELLAVRLERKSREVREAQLEEMRQLYRFAELGQLGTVLLHDLANNLTALTLDIDDLGRKLQRNESITRAKESIAYLESMVNGVRRQIMERDAPVVFDANQAILETLAALGPKAQRARVTLEYAPVPREGVYIKGDPVRFAHVITIIVSNGFEAYYGVKREAPFVRVATARRDGQLQVRISDRGRGIPAAKRATLFEPFASTKPDGMGIGLFMAKEMTEHHFGGSLTLDPKRTPTTFILKIPEASSLAAGEVV